MAGRASVALPALSPRAAGRRPWVRFLPPLSEPGVPISGTGLSSGIMRLAHGFPVASSGRVSSSRGTGLAPLAPAGRCVGRPIDALTTATARVVPFACACDDGPGFPLISGVIGRRPLPRACSLSPSLPPEVPSLCRHYPASSVPTDLSATLPARPDPHGLSVGVCRATAQGFPCCDHSPLPRMPPPLPRRNRSVLAPLTSRPLAAFPVAVNGSASA